MFIKGFFLLNEMRPSVRLKRMAQAISHRMEGQKIRKKYQRMVDQLPKPEYRSNLIKTNTMNNQPPMRCELNIHVEDKGIRLNIPISVQNADEFFKQISSTLYEGNAKIWLSGSFDFKSEQEQEDFFKTFKP